MTQFRDKGNIVRVYPFSYSEFCRANGGDSENVWRDYYTYGGMPRLAALSDRKSKIEYLTNLFSNTYMKGVLERYGIKAEKSVLNTFAYGVVGGSFEDAGRAFTNTVNIID